MPFPANKKLGNQSIATVESGVSVNSVLHEKTHEIKLHESVSVVVPVMDSSTISLIPKKEVTSDQQHPVERRRDNVISSGVMRLIFFCLLEASKGRNMVIFVSI